MESIKQTDLAPQISMALWLTVQFIITESGHALVVGVFPADSSMKKMFVSESIHTLGVQTLKT